MVLSADRIAATEYRQCKIGTTVLQSWLGSIDRFSPALCSTVISKLAAKTFIEERPADEVTHIFGKQVAPAGIGVYNPAFDVTPAPLISGIITEVGIIHPPFHDRLRHHIGDIRERGAAT